ncbi:MAG: bifunctional riboflavin kinase/FAD synthetase [Oscillospiraceae bacterium]|jgi:riboflavin kinase/FMN adenylyltransferase|nr:bifunctional riboflavin kinase/FAD synthetase [Oscillospiraceae bacterium]
MKIYTELTPSAGSTAVALGSFDGLHLGHRAVIAQAVDESGLIPTVLTFTHNPLEDLGGSTGGELMTQQQKTEVLESFGVKQLYLIQFASIMHFSAEQFVTEVLENVCHAKKVCCGFNFTFGDGGRADSSDLSRLCDACGIRTAVMDAVLQGGEPISSTRIRTLVAQGNMDAARELLGRPYSLLGPVRHGQKLGRRLGTPTLNQEIPKTFVMPRFGVYVSRVSLSGGVYCGVTNVGVRPTVDGHHITAETWLPDYDGPEFYGADVRTELLHFLRPEQKFASVEALGEQIRCDGGKAKDFWRKGK